MDRLADLESGAVEPTRPTLVKMAGHYRRPLLTFYMSAPPRIGERAADFRTLTSDQPSGTGALMDTLIRDVHVRQSMVKAALEDEDEAEPLEFVRSRQMSDGQASVLSVIKSLISVPVESFHAQRDAYAAFNLLRMDVEAKGVFVLLKGDLGSYHTAIDFKVYRGFTIVDGVAPFILINDRDAKPAWSFTLLHECVHLILGQSGLKGDWVENDVERFCDDVANEFLLPAIDLELLEIRGEAQSYSLVKQQISEFANDRNLSRSMVAYRAYRAGMIDRPTFTNLCDLFQRQWLQERASKRERKHDIGGAPNYYVVRRHRVGQGLIRLTDRMMQSGAFSTSEAARVLGVKPTQVGEMISPVRTI